MLRAALVVVAITIASSESLSRPELTSAAVHQRASNVRKPKGTDKPAQPAQPITVTVQTQKSAEELEADSREREKDRAIQCEMVRFNRYLVWVGVASIIISE